MEKYIVLAIYLIIQHTLADCNELSNSNLNKLKNLKYFIIDCLRFNPHPSHFSLSEVLRYFKRRLNLNEYYFDKFTFKIWIIIFYCKNYQSM